MDTTWDTLKQRLLFEKDRLMAIVRTTMASVRSIDIEILMMDHSVDEDDNDVSVDLFEASTAPESAARIASAEPAVEAFDILALEHIPDAFEMKIKARACQADIVNTGLLRQDAVVTQPPSSGKTMAYFLAGKALSGTTSRKENMFTLVVEPTQVLCAEQCNALNKWSPGCAATTVRIDAETGNFIDDIENGAADEATDSFEASPLLEFTTGTLEHELTKFNSTIQFLITTPEKLKSTPTLLAALAERRSQGLYAQNVVDESHLVLMWGSTFRSDYLYLAGAFALIAAGTFGSVPPANTRPRLLTLTGTSNEYQDHAVAECLGALPGCSILRSPLDRQELTYHMLDLCHVAGSGFPVLDAACKSLSPMFHEATRSIVFVATKNEADKVVERLRVQGHDASPFYRPRPKVGTGDLAEEKRGGLWTALRMREGRAAWEKSENGAILVATSIASHGLNDEKADLVVHMVWRTDIRLYYQEAGRVGRSGQASKCVFVRHPSLLQAAAWSGSGLLPGTGEGAALLESIQVFGSGCDCRRLRLIRALGDKDIERCMGCDVCSMACRPVHYTTSTVEGTEDAVRIIEEIVSLQGAGPVYFAAVCMKGNWRVHVDTRLANSLVLRLLELGILRLGSHAAVSEKRKILTVEVVDDRAAFVMQARTLVFVELCL